MRDICPQLNQATPRTNPGCPFSITQNCCSRSKNTICISRAAFLLPCSQDSPSLPEKPLNHCYATLSVGVLAVQGSLQPTRYSAPRRGQPWLTNEVELSDKHTALGICDCTELIRQMKRSSSAFQLNYNLFK